MAEGWRNGFCGHCCGGDCGTCMGAWFCSPCLFGRVSARNERFPEMTKEHFNGSCAGFCGLSCLHLAWVLIWIRRGEIRNKFGIKGDGCSDCCASYFCAMNTELKDRASQPLQYDAGKMGYPAEQQGMNYGPPPPQQNFQ